MFSLVRWNELTPGIGQSYKDMLLSIRREYSSNKFKSAILAPITNDSGNSFCCIDFDGLGKDDRRCIVHSSSDIVELCLEFGFDELITISADCYVLGIEAAGILPNLLVRRIIRKNDCQGGFNFGTALETQIAFELIKINDILKPALIIFELIGSSLLFGMNNFNPIVKSNRPYEDFVQLVIPQLNQDNKLCSILFVQRRVADQFLSEKRLSQFWPTMSICANPYRALFIEWEKNKRMADEMLIRLDQAKRISWLNRLLKY